MVSEFIETLINVFGDTESVIDNLGEINKLIVWVGSYSQALLLFHRWFSTACFSRLCLYNQEIIHRRMYNYMYVCACVSVCCAMHVIVYVHVCVYVCARMRLLDQQFGADLLDRTYNCEPLYQYLFVLCVVLFSNQDLYRVSLYHFKKFIHHRLISILNGLAVYIMTWLWFYLDEPLARLCAWWWW